jgi:hypothetical protein
MTEQTGFDDTARGADEARVAQELSGRLRVRGVDVRADDSNDDIVAMQEAVERFEDHVRALGGDLMVDVPPAGHDGQPDDPRFRLPLRDDGESAVEFVRRLRAATTALGAYRRDD